MNQLQRVLDERRRQLRLSYPTLENLTGYPRSTLWNIINGPMRQPPKLEQIEKLAKALDWPPAFLQQLVGEQFGYHIYEHRSPGLQIVMAGWERLSEKEQRAIVAQVQELLRSNSDA